MSLSSQTYNVPNFPLSTTSRPSPLSLCHPPVWAPSLFFEGSWGPSQAPLSSTIPVAGLFSSQPSSQCSQYTSTPLKSEHGTLSKCRFWFTMSWGKRAIRYPAFPTSSGWYPWHCPWATLCGKTIQPDCPTISLVGPAFPQKISYCKMIFYHLYQPALLSSCCLKHISGEQMNKMILTYPPLSPTGFQWKFVWISKSSNLRLKCKYWYIFLEGGVKIIIRLSRNSLIPKDKKHTLNGKMSVTL